MGRAWRLGRDPGEAWRPVQRGRAAAPASLGRGVLGQGEGAVSALARALRARPCASCAPSRSLC